MTQDISPITSISDVGSTKVVLHDQLRASRRLQPRLDHAAARDAIAMELGIRRDFPPEFAHAWRLFALLSRPKHQREFLLRPKKARHFAEANQAPCLCHDIGNKAISGESA